MNWTIYTAGYKILRVLKKRGNHRRLHRMKKIAVILAAVVAVFSVYTVAFAAEEKVGFVDEMAVLQQFPKFKQAQQQIEAIGKKKSEAAKAAFDKETDEKKKANIVQSLQLEMREEESKLMNPILKEINETI
jgi:outer membrane protein